MTNLVRGVYFVVRRRLVGPGRCVRNLWITERGLHRLVSRDYRTFTDNPPPWKRKPRVTSSEPPEPRDWREYVGHSPQERRMGLKNAMLLTIQKMIEQPCSDPSCRCVIHKWIPKGDVIAFLLSDRPSTWNPRTNRHDPVELPMSAKGEVTRK